MAKSKQIKQSDLEKILGLNHDSMSNYYRNKVVSIKLDTINQLCKVF